MITRDAKHARDDLLRFGWMLRRGVDGDESCLIYPRERRLGFEIEMLLAADPQLALDTSGARIDRSSIAIDDPKLIGKEAAGLDGLLDRKDGRQRLERRCYARGPAPGSSSTCSSG